MKKIITAFFGGSFDPPHTGHLELARAALALGGCDRVVWVPSYSPPHKQHRERASFADRLAMVELMVRDDPRMEASDIERRLALEPSYTIDVMAAYERENPDRELRLLIGGDSLLELHTWRQSGELAARYRVLTYPRENTADLPRRLNEYWDDATAGKLLAGVMTGRIFEISSSKIKKTMAKSAERSDINIGALAEPVREYCDKRRLYTGAGEDKVTMVKSDNNETTVTDRGLELAEFCVKCIEDKQGENTVLLPLKGRSTVADYFVIATANSDPQLQALVSYIERQVREKFRLRPLSRPGTGAGGWVLLDFSDVIVHLMTAEVRNRYNLEGIWGAPPAIGGRVSD